MIGTHPKTEFIQSSVFLLKMPRQCRRTIKAFKTNIIQSQLSRLNDIHNLGQITLHSRYVAQHGTVNEAFR